MTSAYRGLHHEDGLVQATASPAADAQNKTTLTTKTNAVCKNTFLLLLYCLSKSSLPTKPWLQILNNVEVDFQIIL